MGWIHIITIEAHFATAAGRRSPRPSELCLQGQDAEVVTLGGVTSGLAVHNRKTVINIKKPPENEQLQGATQPLPVPKGAQGWRPCYSDNLRTHLGRAWREP